MHVLRENRKRLCPLRNEASLNFVSLHSPSIDSVGRRGPSRIKMNALRAFFALDCPLRLLAEGDRFFLLTPPTIS